MSKTTTKEQTMEDRQKLEAMASHVVERTGGELVWKNDGCVDVVGSRALRGKIVRLYLDDGEWDAGVTVYVFTERYVVLASTTFNAPRLSPQFVGSMAYAIAAEVKP